MLSLWSSLKFCCLSKHPLNPLSHKPSLDSSNSAANEDMSKMWTNGDAIT